MLLNKDTKTILHMGGGLNKTEYGRPADLRLRRANLRLCWSANTCECMCGVYKITSFMSSSLLHQQRPVYQVRLP